MVRCVCFYFCHAGRVGMSRDPPFPPGLVCKVQAVYGVCMYQCIECARRVSVSLRPAVCMCARVASEAVSCLVLHSERLHRVSFFVTHHESRVRVIKDRVYYARRMKSTLLHAYITSVQRINM